MKSSCLATLVVACVVAVAVAGCGSGTTIGTAGGGVATAGPPSAGATPTPTATANSAGAPTPVASGSAAANSAAVIPSFPMPLTHSGRWLTDADGRVVIFHGLNVAYKNPPYTPQAQGFTQEDAAMLAREGFSTVRLWIWWQAFEPMPGVWDDSSLAATAQFIGWLHQYGITVRLNFAQVIWGDEFGGIGFPDWGAETDGLPLQNLGGDVEDGIGEASLHVAFDHFWANDPYPGSVGLQDQVAAAWEHVANYFKGTPGVIAYDVINEPEEGSSTGTCEQPAGCPVFDEELLTPFFAKIAAAIRTVDPTTLIQYEPVVLDAVGLFKTYVGGGSDKNLELTFHYYPQTDEELTTTSTLAYQLFENDASNHGDAIENTEFGATDDLTQITDIINTADQQRMGWLYWAFYSTEPTGNPATPMTEVLNPQEGIVYDPTQPPTESNLKVAKLDVLDRPYPFLVAGTPTAWSFNTTTNVFTLSYSTTPVGGGAPSGQPTVIVVPQRLFPSGYTASVIGAVITSQANANALMLEAPSNVSTVSVTVSPVGGAAASARIRNAVVPRRSLHR